MNVITQILLFIAEITSLFFLSRFCLQKAYPVLRRVFRNDRMIIYFISAIYLPGTVIHEMSHYIAALLLNLHPREVQFFPVIEERTVKLGHVLYERDPHDFIRSILVGVAPFWGGIISLWMIIQFKLFPGNVWWHTALFGYLILTITANMFSSRQDLVDAVYIIPLFLIIAALWYLFPLTIATPYIDQSVKLISHFIQAIQIPLLFSLGINGILVILLSVLK